MKKIELHNTTAFRLAMLFSMLFGLLAAAMFALIYWLTTTFVEVQTAKRLQNEAQALIERYQESGVQGLTDAVRDRSVGAGLMNLHYLLADPAGAHLAGNLLAWPENVVAEAGSSRFRRTVQRPAAGTLDLDRDEYYEVVARTVQFPSGHRLLIGIGLYEFTELREQSLGGVMIGSAGTIALSLLVGGLLGRAMLVRVRAIDSALGDIMGGDLTRRINAGGRHDEFAQLTTRINGMLDRIEQLVSSLRAVTNNVSHDLRTPLHRLRSRLEQLMLDADLPGENRTEVESGIHDIDEILVTFSDLLSIAEAEAGTGTGSFEPVDVSQMAATVAELYAAAAEERGLNFHAEVDPGAFAPGKKTLLSQALSNLLDNAIKFTPPGGDVAVRLKLGKAGFELTVTDTGPGIPAADRGRVLDAFERLDSARSTAGSGLGLSVVNAIAALHDAALVLEDNHPGLKASLRFRSGAGGAGQEAVA